MTHLTPVLAAVLVAATVAGAAAQTPATSASSPASSSAPFPASSSATPAAPRVELGAGGAWFLDTNGAGTVALVDTRGSVRLTRTWALEGDFAFRPATNGMGGLYRIQAKWHLPIGGHGGGPGGTLGGFEPHLTFGGAGFVSHWSHPAYDYRRYDNGEVVHMNAASGWSVDAPMYPTVGIGVQKRLGDHLALRADLAMGFGISDYGIGYVVMPSIGLSIPIGRYPAAGNGR